MIIRIVTVSVLAAAALFVAPSAYAAPDQRPAPVAASGITLQDTVVELLAEGRHATTVAERRLIHHELLQAVRDGQ